MDHVPPQQVKRIEGPTPNGGVYAIAYYRDDEGRSATEVEATHVEIVEYTVTGEQVMRTYGTVRHD